jgi:hypothetical protein
MEYIKPQIIDGTALTGRLSRQNRHNRRYLRAKCGQTLQRVAIGLIGVDRPKLLHFVPVFVQQPVAQIPGYPISDHRFTSSAFLSDHPSGESGPWLLRDSRVLAGQRSPRILCLRASHHCHRHPSRVDRLDLAAKQAASVSQGHGSQRARSSRPIVHPRTDATNSGKRSTTNNVKSYRHRIARWPDAQACFA